MKKIFYSPYVLQPIESLNAKTGSLSRKGVLVKVTQGDDWGVADLFTWPEFGDETFQEAIQDKTNLYLRCLELAEKDLFARKEKRSLLKDQFIENNLLILDFKSVDFNSIEFKDCTVKIKGSDQFLELAQILNQVKASSIRFRIDFNSVLAVDEFDEFLSLLSKETLKKIEYIEDPTVWNSEDWQRWNEEIPLALDWSMTDYLAYPQTWSVLVIKPTRQNYEVLSQAVGQLGKKISLTSAMEHPVGLMHGLSYAQTLDQNQLLKQRQGLGESLKQGFLTLDSYKPTDFHKYFLQEGSKIKPSRSVVEDYGIGMTEELNRLSWSESL